MSAHKFIQGKLEFNHVGIDFLMITKTQLLKLAVIWYNNMRIALHM